MFGETDPECPPRRVPSPWDSLTPPPDSPRKQGRIPKLVPEVDEGNVEYKLQLLSPTPARFDRLVTQLKWRLLEGGGQAYYELGVADSGILVGLPRQQLEESLETLDMMASEIGASVIVVKEIEVPPELSTLAESQIERWDGGRSARRKDLLRMMKQDGSPAMSAVELETELSTTDGVDVEESPSVSSLISPPSMDRGSNFTHPIPSSDTLPFDPALAMFTMDLGDDITGYADNEALDGDIPADCVLGFSVNLEIFSVHKPRPTRKRALHFASFPLTHFEYVKKRHKSDYLPSQSTNHTRHTGNTTTRYSEESHSQPRGVQAKFRGDKRQGKTKHSSLPTSVPTCCSTESPTTSVDHHTSSLFSVDEPHVSALGSLQVTAVGPNSGCTSGAGSAISKEPRLIVEALVVWKLPTDEAFLDFEGFSLQ